MVYYMDFAKHPKVEKASNGNQTLLFRKDIPVLK
jgi:hypothetical protein